MKEDISKNILKILCQEKNYIKTEDIARRLLRSKRTILNYMNKVDALATSYHLMLLSKKGKGVYIDADFSYKLKIACALNNNNRSASKQERFYYILHLLLNEDELCRISELESILHLSRPSIYSCLEEIEKWLANYHITLIKTRRNGLYITCGEKRHRLAMNQWYYECNNFMKSFNDHAYYEDTLQLNRCLLQYDQEISNVIVNTIFSNIEELLQIKIFKQDAKRIKKVIQIALIRIKMNKIITLPQSRIDIISFVDSEKNTRKIRRIINEIAQLNISQNEAIYIYTFFITCDKVENHREQKHTINLHDELVKELKYYIAQEVNLPKKIINFFLEEYIVLLKRELIYQIREKKQLNYEYYKNLTDKFEIIDIFAQEVYELTTKYHEIIYKEKFICNIAFLWARCVQQVKRNLKIVLVHDCNYLELAYLKGQIHKFINLTELYGTVVYDEDENIILDATDVDAVLSTVPLDIKEVPCIAISKIMPYYEVNIVNEELNRLYQKVNYYRLIKNPTYFNLIPM